MADYNIINYTSALYITTIKRLFPGKKLKNASNIQFHVIILISILTYSLFNL